MNEITAHNECPAHSYDMAIKNWMPTFYWEVRAKFSEEVTSELKRELHTLPDELQRTTDKRDPLRQQKPKAAKLADQRVHSAASCTGVLLFSSCETVATEYFHSLLPIRSFYCRGPVSLSIFVYWMCWGGLSLAAWQLHPELM